MPNKSVAPITAPSLTDPWLTALSFRLFLPSSLNQGAFAKNIKVMVGHNADEGPLFTPPFVTDDTALLAYIQQAYPSIDMSVARYIIKTLYPAVYDGTYPYTSGLARTVFIVSESIFTCNTNYLDRAYGNNTYAYEFSVPPALHGFDVAYTFYNGVAGAERVVDQVAQAMQQYLTDFAQTGTPNGAGVPNFGVYGTAANEGEFECDRVHAHEGPDSECEVCVVAEGALLLRHNLWWRRRIMTSA